MHKLFDLPTTPTCKVIYVKDDVTYAGIVKTPTSNDGLQALMLERKIGMSQVQRLEPIQPRGDLQHNHPAMNQMARYANTDK